MGGDLEAEDNKRRKGERSNEEMATHESTIWGVHILNLPAQKSLLPEFKKPHRLRGHSNQM